MSSLTLTLIIRFLIILIGAVSLIYLLLGLISYVFFKQKLQNKKMQTGLKGFIILFIVVLFLIILEQVFSSFNFGITKHIRSPSPF